MKLVVGIIVIVEMPVSGGTVTLVGLAEIVKSEEEGAILMVWLVVDWLGAWLNPPKRRT